MKIHPKEFVLEEFLSPISRYDLEVVEHLTRCETCRHRLQVLLKKSPQLTAERTANILQWPSRRSADDKAILDQTGQLLQGQEHALARERTEAPELVVEELTKYPSEQWSLILQSSPRFHTWGIFELLTERTLSTSIRNPDHAKELGLLALRLSECLGNQRYETEFMEDLRARAWAYMGNVYRIKSDLLASEKAFAAARSHLQRGTRDPLERAILLDLESSLRSDQRHFEEALELLHRAVFIFMQSGQQHRAGRSLLKISTVYHYAGNSEISIPFLYQALQLINPKGEPRLLLCARHNLIDALAESGRYLDARTLYRETRPLYRKFPDAWTQNRRKWVKGKISRGLGQTQQAESLFLAARQGFIEEGIPLDTALVSLELATLATRQERTAVSKRLAEEIVPIFSSLHIHREMLAALAYLTPRRPR